MEKKSQVPPKVVEAPPEIAASIERITGEDRIWFEAHPHADSYTRPAAAGEFWPAFDSACVLYVIVMQVRPGFRLRASAIRLHLPESDRVQ